jgi:hypothetical protein
VKACIRIGGWLNPIGSVSLEDCDWHSWEGEVGDEEWGTVSESCWGRWVKDIYAFFFSVFGQCEKEQCFFLYCFLCNIHHFVNTKWISQVPLWFCSMETTLRIPVNILPNFWDKNQIHSFFFSFSDTVISQWTLTCICFFSFSICRYLFTSTYTELCHYLITCKHLSCFFAFTSSVAKNMLYV